MASHLSFDSSHHMMLLIVSTRAARYYRQRVPAFRQEVVKQGGVVPTPILAMGSSKSARSGHATTNERDTINVDESAT